MKNNETNDPTRFACWDCSKEFEKTTKRTIIDKGTQTSVCNKCYSLRLEQKKNNERKTN